VTCSKKNSEAQNTGGAGAVQRSEKGRGEEEFQHKHLKVGSECRREWVKNSPRTDSASKKRKGTGNQQRRHIPKRKGVVIDRPGEGGCESPQEDRA